MIGHCKGCERGKVKLTEHHILPTKLRLEDRDGNTRVIWLCDECHRILEGLIAEYERKVLIRHQWIYHRAIKHFH